MLWAWAYTNQTWCHNVQFHCIINHCNESGLPKLTLFWVGGYTAYNNKLQFSVVGQPSFYFTTPEYSLNNRLFWIGYVLLSAKYAFAGIEKLK